MKNSKENSINNFPSTAHTKGNFTILIPIFGIVLFVCLYITATLFYPGGSSANRTTVGFDWLQNYWCDLLGRYAKNRELNSAQPIALTAMVLLCFTLSVFWFFIPKLFNNSPLNSIIRYTGIAAMMGTVFLFTDFHDIVINVAGTLGTIALTGVFIGLYRKQLYAFFSYGTFCLTMMMGNYFIYKTGFFISLLPIIQKITFLFFLSWICMLDMHLYKMTK
ncbi:MAG: hypothetical protein RJA07_918 [Bacteroidota bacterium]|jgi:hypothetical protein